MESQTVNIAPSYLMMGDKAVVIQFEQIVSIETNKKVQIISRLIEEQNIIGITQLIPAFNNLTVCYDPILIGQGELLQELKKIEGQVSIDFQLNNKTLYVPVAFGGEYGPDLEEIANHAGLSQKEIISILQNTPYYVYMIGFIAGYPYSGDIDKRLSIPRRSNPRMKVEKGTVQIVNNLTGIFTMTAPSGWHLVGWTPMDIFDPHLEQISRLNAGDSIQYVEISKDEAKLWNEERQWEWDLKWNS
ncbi:5-oxoprolinase subunit PxpB [Alkalihalobacillus sp. MEB130]|uniref:5-oxoprolinase subunit PxpB n=1 Tax=Alkalihalobacillus sp. MEB130 TaxID=2976704 RepID=UPI0028DEF5DD|nr:5-oxoprolinase subunit PxpB [Alkalihalobacillus sp. MEB130]MDT8862423.1 5-oxoprolinase subunit PxpB [Alkalihalobacillus sp. MEB130]